MAALLFLLSVFVVPILIYVWTWVFIWAYRRLGRHGEASRSRVPSVTATLVAQGYIPDLVAPSERDWTKPGAYVYVDAPRD